MARARGPDAGGAFDEREEPARIAARLAALWRDAFTAPRRSTVSAWAEEHRRLSPRTGAVAGRWRNDLVPYLAEPMDCACDPAVRRLTIAASAQAGKTECWINQLLWMIDSDPAPALVVFPNKDMARSINTERLLPTVQCTPAAARHLTGRTRDLRTDAVRFDRMDLFLAGSNSEANLATRPIRMLVLDEVEKYLTRAAIETATKRTTTFRNHLIVTVSTRGEEATGDDPLPGVELEYLRGDRRRYFVPCPRCGWFQALRFAAGDGAGGGVRWEGGLEADPHEVQRSAWYACERCAGRIAQTEKHWMLRRGVWAPEGVEPDRAAADGALDVADRDAVERAALPHGDARRWTPRMSGAPASVGDHRSYEIPGALAAFATWGQLARGFVEREGRPDRVFVTESLGEPWRKAGTRADEEELRGYAEDDAARYPQMRGAAPAWTRGLVPAGIEPARRPLVLTGAMDVQLERVVWSVHAWGPREEHFLVEYGETPCPMAEDAERALGNEGDQELRELLRRDPWALVDRAMGATYPALATGEPMEVRRWSIDCGFRTKEVVDFVRRRGPNTIAVRGLDGARMGALYELRTEGDAEVLNINVGIWKSEVFARLRRRPPAPGAWWWPADTGRAYFRQLTSEHLVEERSKRGAVARRWALRPGRRDNHWWDTMVYAFASAHYWGLGELTPGDAAADRERSEAARVPPRGGDAGPAPGFRLRRPGGR